jgi:hypothetical protein
MAADDEEVLFTWMHISDMHRGNADAPDTRRFLDRLENDIIIEAGTLGLMRDLVSRCLRATRARRQCIDQDVGRVA